MRHIGHIVGFEYRDPCPGFDRRKVRGPIARLATPKDPKHTTALEVAAGGKMGHVAVDNDKTGMLLLGPAVLTPGSRLRFPVPARSRGTYAGNSGSRIVIGAVFTLQFRLGSIVGIVKVVPLTANGIGMPTC